MVLASSNLFASSIGRIFVTRGCDFGQFCRTTGLLVRSNQRRAQKGAGEDADQRFRKSRLFGEFYAPALSRKDRNDLKLLRWLYPEPNRKLFRFDGDEIEMNRDYPFAEELLAPDGNFYPGDSKLRPTKPLFPLEGPKGRIYELEKRRVAEKLSAVEEEELQDLRRRHPRIAEVVGKINLVYDHWFSYELKIAQKGLVP
jgi:hypothetical protein